MPKPRLRLVRANTPRTTRACLTKLLTLEHSGNLQGLAFVAVLDTGFTTGSCGVARDKPEETLEMIDYLRDRLAKK